MSTILHTASTPQLAPGTLRAGGLRKAGRGDALRKASLRALRGQREEPGGGHLIELSINIDISSCQINYQSVWEPPPEVSIIITTIAEYDTTQKPKGCHSLRILRISIQNLKLLREARERIENHRHISLPRRQVTRRGPRRSPRAPRPRPRTPLP